MSNYTITTNFGAKDDLPSGNAAKVIKGSEFTTEFTNIKTAVNSKADSVSPTFTGNTALNGTTTFGPDGTSTFNGTVNFTKDVTFDTNTMFVDVSENRVGINTTSPAQKLDVNGNIRVQGTYPKIEFVDTDNNSDFTLINGNGAFLVYDETNSSERMRIDSSGSIGIGTDSPNTSLHVKDGDVRVEHTRPRIYLTDTNNNSDYSIINNNGDFSIYDDTNTAYRMYIDSSGNVGIGTTSPSEALTVSGNIQIEDNDGYLQFKDSNAGADNKLRRIYNAEQNLYISRRNDDGTLESNDVIIDSDGNVGIGTGSPATSLHVLNASDTQIRLSQTGEGSYDLGVIDGDKFAINRDGLTNEFVMSAGNVGIGTSSPNYKLVVSRADVGTLARFQTEDGTHNPELDIATTSTGVKVRSSFSTGIAGSFDISTAGGQSYITFNPNDSEAMRIDKSGNVMVGTTDENAFNGGFSVKTGTVPYINVGHASSVTSGNYYAAFRHGTNTLGTITQTGTTGVHYGSSSDERLKENIADSADAGSKIDAIQIRQFDWKSDGSHQDYGVIAQELVEVAPEAIHQPEDSEEMMGVDYSKLVPMLIKEVQTLRNRVAQLENN